MERLGDGTRPAPDHRLERPAPVQNVLTIGMIPNCHEVTQFRSHMQHANLVRTSGAGVGSPSSMVALVRGVTKVGGHCQTLRSCVPSPDGG